MDSEVEKLNKSQKQKLENMFYTQSLENMQNEERKQEKKKAKDREKRIKKANKEKLKEQEKFDLDTETVIGMTNKNNKIKRNQIQKEMQERSMPSLIHVRQQMTHIQLLFQCRRKEIYRSKMNRRFRRLQHQPNKRQGTKRQTHRHRGQHVFVQTHN